MTSITSLKRLGLFSFLALVLSLASCKKNVESIGQSLQPEEDFLNAIQTDTTTIHASTVKAKSLRGDVFSTVAVGNYSDDVFGVVRCTGILQFQPATSTPRFDPMASIDSVVLHLAYVNSSYGRNDVGLYFTVRELMDTIHLSTSYDTDADIEIAYKNLLTGLKPNLLLIDPKPELAGLTGLSYTPTLDLRLDKELGFRLLHLPTEDLDSFDKFITQFKGLAIGSETVDGQVLNFNYSDPASQLTVHYHVPGDTTAFSYDFVVSSNCEALTLIDHDHHGTALADLTEDNEIPGDQISYMQTAGSTHIKIDISGADWLKDLPGVIINRADLIVPYDFPTKLRPIDYAQLEYKDEDDVFHLTANDDLFGIYSGPVRENVGLYRFNMTRHLQSYLNGDITTGDVYLIPSPFATGFTKTWSVRRSILHGPAFSTDDPTKNMRLVITYSY